MYLGFGPRDLKAASETALTAAPFFSFIVREISILDSSQNPVFKVDVAASVGCLPVNILLSGPKGAYR